jgi:hypothetical protein
MFIIIDEGQAHVDIFAPSLSDEATLPSLLAALIHAAYESTE